MSLVPSNSAVLVQENWIVFSFMICWSICGVSDYGRDEDRSRFVSVTQPTKRSHPDRRDHACWSYCAHFCIGQLLGHLLHSAVLLVSAWMRFAISVIENAVIAGRALHHGCELTSASDRAGYVINL
jgi:hypothetical protein